MFYKDNPEKLLKLISSLIDDTWSDEEIYNYFTALGYDYFFNYNKVKHAILKSKGYIYTP